MKEKVNNFLEDYAKVATVTLSVIIIFVSLFIITSSSLPKKLRVSFLDVGQGDAILIQTPSGHDMLIDGGPNNSVLQKINKQLPLFDRTIDVVEETHSDADHVTGLIPVFENYEVGIVLTTKAIGHTAVFDDLQKHIDVEGAEIHSAQTGDVVDFGDGVSVRVLYPPQKYVPKKDDTNDASVSVVVGFGDQTFLLTGDLPTTEEGKLMSAGLPKNITVYKAGHHGSKTSSSVQLLSYIKPEYSIISAGKNNRYGHPNPETIERLQKYSKDILSTVDRGTITFVSDGQMLEIETEK